MSYAFGNASMARCTHVDPTLMRVAHLAISRSIVDFGMTEEQSRTEAQQRAKVAAGFSKTMDSPHKIQADGWSKGLDLVPWIDGRFQWGDNQWRVTTADGRVLRPFFDIAAAMRSAAVERGVKLRWGAIWDRVLNDLPEDAAGLAQAMEAYKARHPGPDFLDGPHFELVKPW